MGSGVLSKQDYQPLGQGYLVDNIPWQEEIKKRLAQERAVIITEPRPTLGPEEFQPLLLAETPEATEEVLEEVKPPEPTAEELMAQAKLAAEETAKGIEQAAKKSAFEVVEQARWEANDLIVKAKEEAEKEIQLLKEGALEEGRKEGLKKGLEEGFTSGREDGKKSFFETIKKWDGIISETLEERKRLLNDLQPILVDLVGEAFSRCLREEAKKNSGMVTEFAKEALIKAQDRVQLKLHLNPGDIEEVNAQKEQLKLSVGAGHLELVPDARIEKGGCFLETEAGTIDTRLSTVVTQVKESLGVQMTQK